MDLQSILVATGALPNMIDIVVSSLRVQSYEERMQSFFVAEKKMKKNIFRINFNHNRTTPTENSFLQILY